MWEKSDIINFFSLFGISDEQRSHLLSLSLSKTDMDVMTAENLHDIGKFDSNLSDIIVSQWRSECEGRNNVTEALDTVTRNIETWLHFGRCYDNRSILRSSAPVNIASEKPDMQEVNPIGQTPLMASLKDIVEEQKARIIELEEREQTYQDELTRREELVLRLRGEMMELENQLDAHIEDSERLGQWLDKSLGAIFQEVNGLHRSMGSVNNSLEGVVAEAQRSLGTVNSDLHGNGCLRLGIQSITLSGVSGNQHGEKLDPYVEVSLGGSSVKTKAIPRGGGDASWKEVDGELILSDPSEPLIVHVWDDFTLQAPVLVGEGKAPLSDTIFEGNFPGNLITINLGIQGLDGRGVGEVTMSLMPRVGLIKSTSGVIVNGILATALSTASLSRTNSEFSTLFSEQGRVLCNYVSNWRGVMQSLGSLNQICSRVGLTSEELRIIQKDLSRQLEEAVKRYKDHSGVLQRYSADTNALLERLKQEKARIMTENEIREKYTALSTDFNKTRNEANKLRENLADYLLRHEQLSRQYAEALALLDREKQSAAIANSKVDRLQTELDRIIEIVRKDMSDRIICRNATEELVTLSSQLMSRGEGSSVLEPSNQKDIKQEWAQVMNVLGPHMSEQSVAEAKAALLNIRNSFDILSSRLFLECRARAEVEKRLNNTKDDLSKLKEEVLQEVNNRAKLEADLQRAKEIAENESKFALIAKTAAQDAIKQAQYFQRKLNKEIDLLHDQVLVDSSADICQRPDPRTPEARENHENGRCQDEEDFYNGLVLSPETTSRPVRESRRPSQSKRVVKPNDDIMGLNHRSGEVLHTSSESGVYDRKVPVKKRRKFSFPGKGMFKGGSKKHGSKGYSTVAPFIGDDRPEWIEPNHKDYRKGSKFR
mmetsp:Transcript_15455/g.23334  ORF Transcript_15455/g.23334 Transcript_15455/m.23334 type:complete len:882 (-) Transcript_15455:253-2898(-)